MNGRESAVGTHLAYQAHGMTVNQNCHELRCKKKELGIFRHILWRNLWATNRHGESSASPPPRGRGGALLSGRRQNVDDPICHHLASLRAVGSHMR